MTFIETAETEFFGQKKSGVKIQRSLESENTLTIDNICLN